MEASTLLSLVVVIVESTSLVVWIESTVALLSLVVTIEASSLVVTIEASALVEASSLVESTALTTRVSVVVEWRSSIIRSVVRCWKPAETSFMSMIFIGKLVISRLARVFLVSVVIV